MMIALVLDKVPATLFEVGPQKEATVTSSGGGQKRRIVHSTVTFDVPLTSRSIPALGVLLPRLDEQLKGVAAVVEDGGLPFATKIKAKLPPVTIALRYNDPEQPAAVTFPVAEVRSIGLSVSASGDGRARLKFKIRASKKDIGELHDMLGCDLFIDAAQSQITAEEIAEREKSGEANPFRRAKKKKTDEPAAAPQLQLLPVNPTVQHMDDCPVLIGGECDCAAVEVKPNSEPAVEPVRVGAMYEDRDPRRKRVIVVVSVGDTHAIVRPQGAEGPRVSVALAKLGVWTEKRGFKHVGFEAEEPAGELAAAAADGLDGIVDGEVAPPPNGGVVA